MHGTDPGWDKRTEQQNRSSRDAEGKQRRSMAEVARNLPRNSSAADPPGRRADRVIRRSHRSGTR
ncbi:hypothetical protein DFQ14_102452 [Halopolyspora algeriensis]|uniref:Uncharacterized protein n=1 Tax=Halopolyspora algeriensis TaxID=1500506 RepID=A0A368VXR0_9ACTN|nr:hypothetical protein DFQ14_102452 [Halopolyspora algeriensis]TQM55553.1 hypothetical protein FHU43_0327 [Halopolyspora algeriensis]